MKVCITAQGETLDAAVDPRFGRCGYFICIDTETNVLEAVRNPYADSAGGAGIQSGQLVSSKQVQAVITGNVGPHASQTLHAAGISVYTSASGTVRQALEAFTQGTLPRASSSTVNSKFGMDGGAGA